MTLDVTKDIHVAECLLKNREIRRDNEHLRKSERKLVPGEMELFDFLVGHVKTEMSVYVSEGGDPRSLDFLQWVNHRHLDISAQAELAMKVPYSDEQIAAVAIEMRYTVYRLWPVSLHPLVLEVRTDEVAVD